MSAKLLQALRGYDFRVSGRTAPITVEDYRGLARRALPEMVWEFVENGAEDETTLAHNQADFSRWRLRQKVLSGQEGKDLGVDVAGARLELPIALCPTGLNGLVHWHGELGAARAAERSGTRHVSSTVASYTLEEVAEGTRESHWFQLYPWGDREFIGALITRARAAGFGALFVTVDVPVVGVRERALRAGMPTGMATPPVLTPRRLLNGALRPRWALGYVRHQRFVGRDLADAKGAEGAIQAGRAQAGFMRPELVQFLSWETLEWLRDQWTGPLFVKGVTEPDDALRCVELGCDGVVVSNHGGRQLDGMVSSIGALPGVADAVGDRGTVLLDSGIRRGRDVVKALCLGASACMIGRPFLYGLAVRGEKGVADILKILKTEIETTLTLMGCTSVKKLDRSWLTRDDG